MSSNIKGVFAHLDCLVDAIADLRTAGIHDFEVASPFPRHDLEEVIYGGAPPSPIRWWTLIGGVTGGTFGFTLAALTSADWPMTIPAGKPIVSIPPFMIPTFECTVLFGALFTLLGLIYHCRLPLLNPVAELEDPRFSDDCFGIVVKNVASGDRAKVQHILSHAGAVEVSPKEAVHA